MKIAVPGVKVYRARGNLYAYHRATGTRIRAEIGTAAFLAEIERLNGRALAEKPKGGTLGALIAGYRASPEYTELAPRTRADYGKVFDYLKPLDADPLSSFTSSTMLKIRDAAFKKHKRRFANYTVAVLSVLFRWGSIREMVATNIASAVPKLRRPHGAPRANRAWSDAECETVLQAATGGLRVVIALGMFAAMREGDAIRAARSWYDGEWIRWSQGKTGNPVELPVDSRLKAILDELPDDRIILAIGERGRSYTLEGFRTVFFRLIKSLEAAGRVEPGLTFHGLRHTAGKTLAELGADPRMIGVLLGHKTLQMAALYSDEADRKKLALAAVTKLDPRRK